jgi:hypothetical protein
VTLAKRPAIRGVRTNPFFVLVAAILLVILVALLNSYLEQHWPALCRLNQRQFITKGPHGAECLRGVQ